MTDRVNALVVVLEEDVREDEVETLMAVIKQFKGVLTVEKNVRDIQTLISTKRARQELLNKLYKVLSPEES